MRRTVGVVSLTSASAGDCDGIKPAAPTTPATEIEMAQQLNILLIDNTTVVTVAIPANMQSARPGLNPYDTMIATIFRRGYFWNAAQTTACPTSQIKNITYQ
jgi:hypothetical protein